MPRGRYPTAPTIGGRLSAPLVLAVSPAARPPIPALFRLPDGSGAGRSLDHFANTVDVMPTLLDLAGLPTPRGVQGRSLLPLIRGAKVPWRDAVFSELGPDDRRVKMVRTDEWKLVYYWPRAEGGRNELRRYHPVGASRRPAGTSSQGPAGECDAGKRVKDVLFVE